MDKNSNSRQNELGWKKRIRDELIPGPELDLVLEQVFVGFGRMVAKPCSELTFFSFESLMSIKMGCPVEQQFVVA